MFFFETLSHHHESMGGNNFIPMNVHDTAIHGQAQNGAPIKS